MILRVFSGNPRWFFLFFIIYASYLSGFFGEKKDEQLFLRNVSHDVSQTRAVKGSSIVNKQRFLVSSQVQELGIGVTKARTVPSPTPVGHPDLSGGQAGEWGVAKQIDTYTWTLQVGQDKKNGTPQEILSALNSYRQKNGRGALTWNEKLADFASSRASFFDSHAKLDGHAGFTDYVNKQDGFHKLGFGSVGENSSLGYTLEGVHLIEWVYAGDKPHNDNQLSSKWSSVGIGVSGTATDLIFGGSKL